MQYMISYIIEQINILYAISYIGYKISNIVW